MRPRHAPVALLVAAGLVLAAPAAAASAHDYLVSSTPAASSTITAQPGTVALTFDAAVLSYGRGSTALEVTDAAGAHFETSCAHIADRTVSARTVLGASGVYTVTWRVVSADGHPVGDSIRFTYRAPAGAVVGRGTATGPDCGLRVQSSPAATSTGPGGIGGLVWVIIGVAVLVIAGVLVIAFAPLGKRGGAPADTDGGGSEGAEPDDPADSEPDVEPGRDG